MDSNILSTLQCILRPRSMNLEGWKTEKNLRLVDVNKGVAYMKNFKTRLIHWISPTSYLTNLQELPPTNQ